MLVIKALRYNTRALRWRLRAAERIQFKLVIMTFRCQCLCGMHSSSCYCQLLFIVSLTFLPVDAYTFFHRRPDYSSDKTSYRRRPCVSGRRCKHLERTSRRYNYIPVTDWIDRNDAKWISLPRMRKRQFPSQSMRFPRPRQLVHWPHFFTPRYFVSLWRHTAYFRPEHDVRWLLKCI